MTLLALASVRLFSQTPVEDLIIRYEDASGARNFMAQGLKMTLARKLLDATPLAPVAPDVERLYVLKMAAVTQSVRLHFVSDLHATLEKYEYYGTHPSKNGTVDIYILRSDPETVEELVIYNPAIYSLNSLYGHFTMQELLSLDKK